MSDSLLSFFNALLIVGIAELGDKTQLLVVAFSSKYKFRDIFFGIIIAIFANSLIAILFGMFVGSTFADKLLYVKVFAGLLFLSFSLWSLRDCKEECENVKESRINPLLSVAFAFFIAEFGDKTQITTASLAATNAKSAWFIFMGSAAGLLAANIIAIVIGLYLCKNLPAKIFRFVSAGIFGVFGIITLYTPLKTLFGTHIALASLAATVIVMLRITLILCIRRRGLSKRGFHK